MSVPPGATITLDYKKDYATDATVKWSVLSGSGSMQGTATLKKNTTKVTGGTGAYTKLKGSKSSRRTGTARGLDSRSAPGGAAAAPRRCCCQCAGESRSGRGGAPNGMAHPPDPIGSSRLDVFKHNSLDCCAGCEYALQFEQS